MAYTELTAIKDLENIADEAIATVSVSADYIDLHSIEVLNKVQWDMARIAVKCNALAHVANDFICVSSFAKGASLEATRVFESLRAVDHKSEVSAYTAVKWAKHTVKQYFGNLKKTIVAIWEQCDD